MSDKTKEKENIVQKKYSSTVFGTIRGLTTLQIFVLEKRYSGEEHTEKEWDKIITKDNF